MVVVLLVIGFFVVTSSGFLRAVVLPKVGDSLNAKVTAGEVSLSPLKQIVLKDLRVQTTGAEPLLTSAEVRVDYHLFELLRGHINLDLISLSKPVITLIENPDQTSNLEPILNRPGEEAKPAAPAKPLQVEIKKIMVTDGTVRQIKRFDASHRDETVISQLNLEITNVQNGETGQASATADLVYDSNPPPPGTPGRAQASLDGKFQFTLAPDLGLAAAQGHSRVEVTRAENSLAEAAGLALVLDADIAPAEIKRAALQFEKAGQPLGELLAHGPFDLAKTEGRLNVEIRGIDRRLLNLAGASSGLDFGPTTFNSSNRLEIAQAGAVVSAAGQFDLANFQITRTNETTPPLDLRANYDLTVDSTARQAVLRSLDLNGLEQGRPLLNGGLTHPMNFAWGGASNAVGEAALNLALTGLNLAHWQAFIGDSIPSGMVNAKVRLISQQGGQKLSFDAESDISNLAVQSGTNRISQLALKAEAKGEALELNQFTLPAFSLHLSQAGEELVDVTGAGSFDQRAETARVEMRGRASLPSLIKMAPAADLRASSGRIEFNGRVAREKDAQKVDGRLVLADFTGAFGDNQFQKFGITADLEAALVGQALNIARLDGGLSQGDNPGGTFHLNGTVNLTNQAAQITGRLENFNQHGLRPFLEPIFAEKQLVSVALNGQATAQYVPAGPSSMNADLQITNLVVKDPKLPALATPLAAKLALDASLNKEVIEVRRASLALAPTARATNEVVLTGKIDLSDTNAVQGGLKLSADSLDLTSYYDLFAGSAPETAAAPSPAPAAPAAEKDAEPITLPFKDFTTEAAVNRLYLHEVEIADAQILVRLDPSRAVLGPMKWVLNGAPVSGRLEVDTSVPGYKYTTEFSAEKVPLAPLVNSFQPERKGQLGGTLTGNLRLTGAGTIWPTIERNLNGTFYAGSTNLDLSVLHIQNPMLKTILNVVAIIPDLVKNPDHIVSGIIGALAPQATPGGRGGLSDELSRSPIDQIVLQGAIANQRLDVQQAFVQSPAFQAKAAGTVAFQPILSNSVVQIPVSLALSRNLAQRANLLSPNTPTNAAFVPLPDFVTIRGTIGEPKTDINKAALLGAVAKSLGGVLPSGEGGNLLQGLGSLLTKPAATNAPGAPAQTNHTGNLLQGLGGLLGAPAPAATNSPPAATNQTPVGNLLNQLLGPKKR